jgi:hypothetical protein
MAIGRAGQATRFICKLFSTACDPQKPEPFSLAARCVKKFHVVRALKLDNSCGSNTDDQRRFIYWSANNFRAALKGVGSCWPCFRSNSALIIRGYCGSWRSIKMMKHSRHDIGQVGQQTTR